MKKTIKLLFLCLFMLCVGVLVGCNDGGTDKPIDKPDDGNVDDPGENDETVYDFMGDDFVIMVDQLSADPRQSTYQRMFKNEKVELINKVEEKYNLHVKYVQYPSEASWGSAREQYIIKSAAAGTVRAHVYEIPSTSIGVLAVNKAISPLDDYIDAMGNTGMWKSSLVYGTSMGKVYSYYDNFPLADEGIFYNIDLLEQYLGKGKGELPSELWLSGEWTWAKYEEICKQLDQLLPEDYFVMGGAPYNWSYQMLGANGVHVVDTSFKSQLDSQEGIDTITYLNTLYNSVRWDWNVNPSNATSTSMVTGKVAFHNGQSYWIFQANKWLDKEFKIGFVPYPKGPNVKDDLSNYYINDVYGKTQFVISSSYSKDKVPAGYENSTLHDEIIFKIWSELQYLPEIDSTTNEASVEDYFDEYQVARCEKYYGGEKSVEAHRSIMDKAYPDRFFTLSNSQAQTDEGFGFKLRTIIRGDSNDIRSSLQSMVTQIHQGFKDLYNLADDYYA